MLALLAAKILMNALHVQNWFVKFVIQTIKLKGFFQKIFNNTLL